MKTSGKYALETINGLLMEPLNPSYTITYHYTLDPLTMK